MDFLVRLFRHLPEGTLFFISGVVFFSCCLMTFPDVYSFLEREHKGLFEISFWFFALCLFVVVGIFSVVVPRRMIDPPERSVYNYLEYEKDVRRLLIRLGIIVVLLALIAPIQINKGFAILAERDEMQRQMPLRPMLVESIMEKTKDCTVGTVVSAEEIKWGIYVPQHQLYHPDDELLTDDLRNVNSVAMVVDTKTINFGTYSNLDESVRRKVSGTEYYACLMNLESGEIFRFKISISPGNSIRTTTSSYGNRSFGMTVGNHFAGWVRWVATNGLSDEATFVSREELGNGARGGGIQRW